MALNYKVAIISTWWKKGGLDVRFFDTKSNQKTYFDNLISGWSDLLNFNFNDNITTTLTFIDSTTRNIETLLKCNYAIVKDSNNNYRYFFISSIMADSNRKVIIDIELDDINTNLVENLNVRAFINNWTGGNIIRYLEGGTYKYKFDFTNKTLVPTEDAPQLFNNTSVKGFIKHSNLSNINTWLNENVEAWQWTFINANNNLISPLVNSTWFESINNIINIVKFSSNNSVTLPYKTLCSPIYKEGSTKKIYIKCNDSDYGSTIYFKLDSIATLMFFTLEGYIQGHGTLYKNGPIGTYGLVQKISNLGVLSANNLIASKYEIDANGDLIITCSNNVVFKNLFNFENTSFVMFCQNWDGSNPPISKATAYYGIVGGYMQTNTTFELEFDNPIKLEGLTETEAKIEDTKLLDANYTKLRLRIANQEYNYNPIAYLDNTNITKITAYYTEVIQVGTSKIYLRLKNNDEYKNNEVDYVGLIASLDLSTPLLTNQWSDYLASHKNYYMQTAFNNTIGLVKGYSGALTSKTGLQAITKGMTTTMDYFSNIKNQNWERENMQQAPDGLSNANGDPYFNLAISGIKPTLDFLTLSNKDRLCIIEKFKKLGVPYEEYKNLTQVILKHNNYDFINCSLEKNTYNISNLEYERLFRKLYNGVRLWYNDNTTLKDINYLE